jgi:hypothetical protein
MNVIVIDKEVWHQNLQNFMVDFVVVIAEHEICGSKIGVKKALEREQKEIIAAGGSVVRGRGNCHHTFYRCFVGR